MRIKNRAIQLLTTSALTVGLGVGISTTAHANPAGSVIVTLNANSTCGVAVDGRVLRVYVITSDGWSDSTTPPPSQLELFNVKKEAVKATVLNSGGLWPEIEPPAVVGHTWAVYHAHYKEGVSGKYYHYRNFSICA